MAAAIATERIAGRVITKELNLLPGHVGCLHFGNGDTYDKRSSTSHVVGYWYASIPPNNAPQKPMKLPPKLELEPSPVPIV